MYAQVGLIRHTLICTAFWVSGLSAVDLERSEHALFCPLCLWLLESAKSLGVQKAVSACPPGFLWLCEGRTLCPASSRSEEISPSTNRKLRPRATLSKEEEGERVSGELMLNQTVKQKDSGMWFMLGILFSPLLLDYCGLLSMNFLTLCLSLCAAVMCSDSDTFGGDNLAIGSYRLWLLSALKWMLTVLECSKNFTPYNFQLMGTSYAFPIFCHTVDDLHIKHDQSLRWVKSYSFRLL